MQNPYSRKPLWLLVAAGLSLALSSRLSAQNDAPQRTFFEISYMKANNSDYVSIERDVWQPLHNQRIKSGKLGWWGFFQLGSPSGTKADYDYVTVNVYSSLNQMATSYNELEKDFKAAHPGKDYQELMQKTGASRDILWTEVFEVVGSALPPDNQVPPVVVANRMKVRPVNAADYVKMEMEIFQPAHKVASEKGHRLNWWLVSRVLPYGTSYGYDFMTFDVYKNLDDMVNPVPQSVWQEAHKGKDLGKMFESLDVDAQREMIRSDVWMGIASTDPQE